MMGMVDLGLLTSLFYVDRFSITGKMPGSKTTRHFPRVSDSAIPCEISGLVVAVKVFRCGYESRG